MWLQVRMEATAAAHARWLQAGRPGKPFAGEAEIRPFGDGVEAVVAMQYPETMVIGQRGDDAINRQQSMVPSAGELMLRIDRHQLAQQFFVIGSVAR